MNYVPSTIHSRSWQLLVSVHRRRLPSTPHYSHFVRLPATFYTVLSCTLIGDKIIEYCKIRNTLFRCYGCTVHWAGELTGPCKMWRLKLKVNAHTHFIKLLSLWILPFLLGWGCSKDNMSIWPLCISIQGHSRSNSSYAYDRHTWVSYLHFIQTHSFDAPLSIIEKTRRFWTGTNTMKFSEMYNILHNSYGMSFMWL